MEVDTHTHGIQLSQTQSLDTAAAETAARAKAKARARAKASIADTVELILWLKSEQARITRECKELNSQGYQTTALYSYWRILEKQIQALEFELIVEKSDDMALEE
ncbi:hypothetical protein FBU30_010761 [Linnemannia zychae]|nr:hypothetical protein FBU30_010761 [Linnemannia zychae]